MGFMDFYILMTNLGRCQTQGGELYLYSMTTNTEAPCATLSAARIYPDYTSPPINSGIFGACTRRVTLALRTVAWFR